MERCATTDVVMLHVEMDVDTVGSVPLHPRKRTEPTTRPSRNPHGVPGIPRRAKEGLGSGEPLPAEESEGGGDKIPPRVVEREERRRRTRPRNGVHLPRPCEYSQEGLFRKYEYSQGDPGIEEEVPPDGPWWGPELTS